MSRMKTLSTLAILLIIVGVIGSLFTFQSVFQAEEVVEEKVINDPFHAIEVTTESASVTVLPTNEATAHLAISGKFGNTSTYQAATTVKDGLLSIEVDDKRKKLFNFFPTFAEVTVYLPESNYESLHVKNDNGRITIEEVLIGEVKAETDNGKIIISDMTGHTLTSKTSNGSIELTDVNTESVNVRTNNGKIKLARVEGTIVGRTDNGSISLQVSDLNRAIELETDNGHITVETDEKPTNATIQASVGNGKVDVFGQSSNHTVIGDGEHVLQLSSDNGSITVK